MRGNRIVSLNGQQVRSPAAKPRGSKDYATLSSQLEREDSAQALSGSSLSSF